MPARTTRSQRRRAKKPRKRTLASNKRAEKKRKSPKVKAKSTRAKAKRVRAAKKKTRVARKPSRVAARKRSRPATKRRRARGGRTSKKSVAAARRKKARKPVRTASTAKKRVKATRRKRPASSAKSTRRRTKSAAVKTPRSSRKRVDKTRKRRARVAKPSGRAAKLSAAKRVKRAVVASVEAARVETSQVATTELRTGTSTEAIEASPSQAVDVSTEGTKKKALKPSILKSASVSEKPESTADGAVADTPVKLLSKVKLKKKLKSKGSHAAKSSTPARPPLPLKQYTFIGVPSFNGPRPVRPTIPPPPPPAPPPAPATLEERIARLQERLEKQPEDFRQRYQENLDMSWIYHDSALEGVVYSFQELKTAMDPSASPIQDSTLQPVCEDVRRHKAAIEFVRDHGTKKLPVTLDVVKRVFLILHPEEGDIKTVKYRKDIPQHRLYFHEYAPPDKIAYKVRQIVDWINDPETRRGRNALRIAARAHYDLLRVFPFAQDSGKVARLVMNLLLIRAGYEPAIIHSAERQRYYEALKGSAAMIIHMVQEAEENGLASIEKMLEEHETNTRSFVS